MHKGCHRLYVIINTGQKFVGYKFHPGEEGAKKAKYSPDENFWLHGTFLYLSKFPIKWYFYTLSLLINIFPGSLILKPHPQCLNDGCGCWDHMTPNHYILVAIASSIWTQRAQTQCFILNLTHEAREREGGRKREREREREREGKGEGKREVCVSESERETCKTKSLPIHWLTYVSLLQVYSLSLSPHSPPTSCLSSSHSLSWEAGFSARYHSIHVNM